MLFAATVTAADTNTVLTGWLAAQTHLHTWQADFIQTRALKALTQPLVSTGLVWFARPNQFRWELGAPAQTLAVRRDDDLFVVYPLLKRAERYPLGPAASGQWRDALDLLETGFPQSRADLDARFRVVSLTETNGAWQLGLQPARAAARRMIQEVRVGLGTNDFSLASTELVFADGSRLRNDFTNAVFNPTLTPEHFRWQAPPDFKVVEPLPR